MGFFFSHASLLNVLKVSVFVQKVSDNEQLLAY